VGIGWQNVRGVKEKYKCHFHWRVRGKLERKNGEYPKGVIIVVWKEEIDGKVMN